MICGAGYMVAMVHMWKSEENMQESVFFHYVDHLLTWLLMCSPEKKTFLITHNSTIIKLQGIEIDTWWLNQESKKKQAPIY